MENTKIIEDYSDSLQENILATEKPIGWSSICLDQTINYYIECNSATISSDIQSGNEINHN